MENGETTFTGPTPTVQGVVLDILRKQGMLGLVLVAQMYFIWNDAKENRKQQDRVFPVLERNSDVIGKNSVVLDRAMVIGEKTTAAVERLERRVNSSVRR